MKYPHESAGVMSFFSMSDFREEHPDHVFGWMRLEQAVQRAQERASRRGRRQKVRLWSTSYPTNRGTPERYGYWVIYDA